MKCTFCNQEIEQGTGTSVVQLDGKVNVFCSSKCRKNMLYLHRNPAKVTWIRKKKR